EALYELRRKLLRSSRDRGGRNVIANIRVTDPALEEETLQREYLDNARHTLRAIRKEIVRELIRERVPRWVVKLAAERMTKLSIEACPEEKGERLGYNAETYHRNIKFYGESQVDESGTHELCHTIVQISSMAYAARPSMHEFLTELLSRLVQAR